MDLIVIALIVLTIVVLIVSLAYIIVTTRHKERMALLEKGLDPKEYLNDRFLPNTLRLGMFTFGIGLGFIVALTLDEFIFVELDNPALYAGVLLLFGGLGLIAFYWFFKKK